MPNNVDTARAIYQHFGRGEVPAILELCAEDVEWEWAYHDDYPPWMRPRRGRAGVAAFFAAVGEHLAFSHFEPRRVINDGDLVVVLVDLDATVKGTGKTISERLEPHLIEFDARGRVKRFRHAADTLAQQRAFQP